MGISFMNNDLSAVKYIQEQGDGVKTINMSSNMGLRDYEWMSLCILMVSII